MLNKNNKPQQGFTLVEIAIVLLIIGLLIGGILRGQELITSARVRNMIDQKSSVQAAMISFHDRYKMLAGDLTAAQATAVGSNAHPAPNSPGNGMINWQDSIALFQNLTVTGFLDCGPCATSLAWEQVPTVNNTLINNFGDALWVSGSFGGWPNFPTCCGIGSKAFLANTDEPLRTILSTGVGASPQILAELDRKADDGMPATGSFRQHGLAAIFVDQFTTCSPRNVAGVFTWSPTNNGAKCQGGWIL